MNDIESSPNWATEHTQPLNQYTTLKICIQNDQATSPTRNEVRMLQRLKEKAQAADHPGLGFTRLASDIFEIKGRWGRHYCIASNPKGCSLCTLQESFPGARLPKILVKSFMHRLLFSVNWLHATCGVIHTDISPQNVLTEVDDAEVSFSLLEDEELQDPSVPLAVDETLIHKTRSTLQELSGLPILTDFGQMRLAEQANTDWWMSDMYRARGDFGAALELSRGYLVIGNHGKSLFDPIDRVHGQYVLPLALAQYIGYLGPPPLALAMESRLFPEYFDNEGQWISEPPIPKTSLEDFVTTIPPGEEKDMFLRFIRKILTWDSEVRATPNELIEDEWLMMPVEEF